MWIHKAEWPKPKPQHICPPRYVLVFGPKSPPAPGSIWECDECHKQYQLKHYEMGVSVWEELKSIHYSRMA